MSLGQIAARALFPKLYEDEAVVSYKDYKALEADRDRETQRANDVILTISDHDLVTQRTARALTAGLIRNYFVSLGCSIEDPRVRNLEMTKHCNLEHKREISLIIKMSLEFSYHNEFVTDQLANAYRVLAESSEHKNTNHQVYDALLKATESTAAVLNKFIISKQNVTNYMNIRLPELKKSIKWIGDTCKIEPSSITPFSTFDINLLKSGLAVEKPLKINESPKTCQLEEALRTSWVY